VAQDSGGEKTEQPTPKKRQDARDEGQVAFSPEINTAGVLLIGFCALAALGERMWSTWAIALRRAVGDHLTDEITGIESVARLAGQYLPVAGTLVAFLGIIFLGVIILGLAQVGLHLTWKPLMPKLTRISPMTGFGRIFGVRGLVRVLVSVLKMALIAGVAWHAIAQDLPRQIAIDERIGYRFGVELSSLLGIALRLVAMMAIVAVIDFLYQRFQHTKDLMMTKQEVKEEYKQSEGDPLVKGKIRQIQRAMAQKRMMQEVPKADVVITNPTHVAVALKYDKDTMAAPEVVAKGYDDVAQRIKAIAKEHGIPQVENVPLARALAKEVEIGRAVPTKWYQAVAEVLAVVYKLKKAA
jgi:flagellar biosynthetic protein FlhB